MIGGYSAVGAKLKAMYAGAVSNEEFNRLAEKKTVSEICSYLKSETSYSNVLSDVNESDAHRGQLEFLMEEKLFGDFSNIYRFMDKVDTEVIEFYFIRREIEFLKQEIHYIYTHEKRHDDSLENDGYERSFMTNTKFNIDMIKNASSLEECLEACRNTRYEKTLERAINLKADFFSLGMLLDEYYYRTLWNVINTKVAKKEREPLLKIVGSSVDMLNIMWIYRGKKYFNFREEIIFAYLLPVRYRLSAETVKDLVNAGSIDEFLEKVSNTPYAELFESADNGIFAEENYSYMLYKIAKSVFTMHTSSLAAVVAYAKLREYEIWRITTVIEGVRYGKAPELIRRHIRTA